MTLATAINTSFWLQCHHQLNLSSLDFLARRQVERTEQFDSDIYVSNFYFRNNRHDNQYGAGAGLEIDPVEIKDRP
ncbi:uncharacterized protein PHALS_13772 [Plasmopara halstedii]|uniref:Uncharacterized protein n=1 Tax=Plasmopara halstedii TaxID=4781 RepID=A0A0P1AQI7_PLAHL|nr:uncharacterized protein PHALS_13772 [Plasmopara halstedii]CEG43580.1 hypothetical protein PHALS_13772 [Plasmopara halstedii]|eukprot:XP_024579949.1 hypothetical protein PHALS_13772 [Plasmopara halstedii]